MIHRTKNHMWEIKPRAKDLIKCIGCINPTKIEFVCEKQIKWVTNTIKKTVESWKNVVENKL